MILQTRIYVYKQSKWGLPLTTTSATRLSPQDAVMQVLATSCYGLQRATEIMDRGSLVFSSEEAIEASSWLFGHLETYHWLAAYFYERRHLLFKVRCKTHYLQHVAEDILQLRLNPCLFHTWDEESFLGKIKCFAVRCHGATCSQRVFMRYLLCMSIFLEDLRKTESFWK